MKSITYAYNLVIISLLNVKNMLAGTVIARHSLADFLPAEYIDGLPRTASTIRWWAGEHVIEPNSHRAILSINLADEDSGIPRAAVFTELTLALDLDTGEIEAPSGPRWERALNCARANAWLVPDAAAERQRERFRKLCRAQG